MRSSLLQNCFHGFGTKEDGDGRDIGTIKKILQKAGSQYSSIIIPQQTHGTNVETVEMSNGSDVVHVSNGDGLVTSQSEIVLTVLTADCVPIIYSDPVAGIIGISHAGWRGVLHDIIKNVISTMEKNGSERVNIQVAIGPCIDSCCYELYGERKHDFEAIFDKSIFANFEGKTYLSLAKACKSLLINAGIVSANIEMMRSCTSCHESEFYSYHRDGKIIGEMASYIYLS